MTVKYPEMIENLPAPDVAGHGLQCRLLQAGDKQVIFFEATETGSLPPHSHGAQWGIVIEGRCEVTIGGETRIYETGDAYFIPDGVVHSSAWIGQFKAIDVFDQPDRYKPKS